MRFLCAGLLVISIVACAANGNVVPQGALSPLRAARSEAQGHLAIRIHIPKRKTRGRIARYISPSSKGLKIKFAGPATLDKTIGLTASSPGCSAGASGTTCTVEFLMKACPSAANCYSGSIATYDNVSCSGTSCTIPAGAKRLSANQSVAFSIASAKLNHIRLTLDGIPASVAISPSPGSTLTGTSGSGFSISKCVTAPQNVTVFGLDADGNTIVGPGAPTSVTLSSDDTTHLAVATPGPSASPNAFALVPPASLVSATIPNANSVVHLTASVTPLAGSGSTTPVNSQIDVTFNGDVCGVMTEYSNGLTADAGLAGITVGSDNNLWFVEDQFNNIVSITTGGAIQEHGVTASQNRFFLCNHKRSGWEPMVR